LQTSGAARREIAKVYSDVVTLPKIKRGRAADQLLEHRGEGARAGIAEIEGDRRYLVAGRAVSRNAEPGPMSRCNEIC
jgi:hypothetical protein